MQTRTSAFTRLRWMSRRSLVVAAGLAVGAGALASPALASTPPADVPAGANDELFAMLGRLPASGFPLLEPGAMVQYVDYDFLWERLGVGPDRDERWEHVGGMSAVGSYTLPPTTFDPNMIPEAVDEVGFAIGDFRSEASIILPPQSVSVAHVGVEPSAVTSAFQSDPNWSPDLQVVDGASGQYFRWGDDPTAVDPARRSAFHSLGRGGVAAVEDGSDGGAVVTRSFDENSLIASLATSAGSEPSVLDAGTISMVLPALGDAEVVQLLAISSPTLANPLAAIDLSQLDTDELADQIAEQMAGADDGIAPYLGAVVVERTDGTSTWAEVHLPFLTADDAAANEAAVEGWIADDTSPLGPPISELLIDATVAANGNVVTITLPDPSGFRNATQLVINRGLAPVGA